MKRFLPLLAIIFLIPTVSAEEGWWMTESLRLIQTNLRQTDSTLDAENLASQIAEFPANTLLFSIGGIVAHYPTQVEYHYPSEYLPEGVDLVGEMLKEAHERGIRVIGRFDFSRARRQVYDAHPEWFFRNREGNPVFDDNDLYSSCINGGYYSEKAIEVLTEALERYDVDGLFFNWFGNLRTDYHGNDIGLCHCDTCKQRFQADYGREIPEDPDLEYSEFMFQSSREVARKIRNLIKEKRPGALFMTYIQEYTDGIVDEADFYKWRPLPQWIYSASENVNRALNTKPEKMAFDLVMPYQEMRYRFASVAGPSLRALLYQNISQGAFPAFVVLGTLDQPDKTALDEVRPVFRWHSEHEKTLVGQTSAARVMLYADQGRGWSSNSANYRGFYRLLSELHIPFKVTNFLETIKPDSLDLIVIPEGQVPAKIRGYVEEGGRVLIAGTEHPRFGLPPAVKIWGDTRSSYMRIENHDRFPSLKRTWVLFCEGDFLELEPVRTAAVTFIPPGQFGPPDKVSALTEETDIPGLIVKRFGRGELAYIPWNIGQLYYRHSNDKHRMFISDVIDTLLPRGRQLTTNAHPLVEITIMKGSERRQTLIHLTNLIGHSGTAFFETVEMRNIQLELRENFVQAKALRLEEDLQVKSQEGSTSIVLPRLVEHETIVMTK